MSLFNVLYGSGIFVFLLGAAWACAVFYLKRSFVRARIAVARGNYDGGLAGYLRLISLSRRFRQEDLHANALNDAGVCLIATGHAQEAIPLLRESADSRSKMKKKHDEISSLGNLSVAYREVGELTQALKENSAALALCDELNDGSAKSECLSNRGIILDRMGDTNAAKQAYITSIEEGERVQDQARIAHAEANLSFLARKLGSAAESLDAATRALPYFNARNDAESTKKLDDVIEWAKNNI